MASGKVTLNGISYYYDQYGNKVPVNTSQEDLGPNDVSPNAPMTVTPNGVSKGLTSIAPQQQAVQVAANAPTPQQAVLNAGKSVAEAAAAKEAASFLPGGAGLGGIAAGAATGYEQYQGIKSELAGQKESPLEGVATFPFDGGIGLANSLFGGGSSTHVEEANRQELAKQGIVVPNSDVKEWENNPVFAKTRNESDLKGLDIIHAAQFYMQDPKYQSLTPEAQQARADEALKDQVIREEHGQIDVGLNDAYQKFVQSQDNPVAENTAPGKKKESSGPSRQAVAQNKKQNTISQLTRIIPELNTPIAAPPRYDINPSPLIKNPYL